MNILNRFGTLIALAVIIAVFSAASPYGFARIGNLVNITQQMSLLAIVAIGATLVMVLGEFDLSVSAMVSWGGIVAVTLFQAGVGTVPVFAIVLLSCLVIGTSSGVLVASFRVPSFIATLAMGGLTFWLSDGATLFGGMPDGFRDLARGTALGLPVLTWWMIAAGLLVWLVLDRVE